VIVDLFAGPGGWDHGLTLLGRRDVVGLEVDAAACATRAAAGHLTIRCDVAAYPTAPFTSAGVEGLIASAPCQAFSRAGKRAGIADLPALLAHIAACHTGWQPPPTTWADPRSALALEPLRWTAALHPRWVALEQVPDALPLWTEYATTLTAWGYQTWAGVLCAADYGVPQTRRRAILLAHRHRPVGAPPPTHFDPRPGPPLFGDPWVSMADALGVTAALDPWRGAGMVERYGQRRAHPPGEPAPTVTGHASRARWVIDTGVNTERGQGVPARYQRPTGEPAPTVTGKAGGQWTLRMSNQAHASVRTLDEPASTVVTGHALNDIRWLRDTPAPTVCGHRVPRWAYSCEPSDREREPDSVRVEQWHLAVLQGFPADYPWQGTRTKQAEQVGNAVPPPLAAAVLAPLIAGDADA